MTAEHLEQTLRKLPLRDLIIRIEGRPGRLVAAVVSPDFAVVEENDRQVQVWQHLMHAYPGDERDGIEYVFTYTPEELAADERGETIEA